MRREVAFPDSEQQQLRTEAKEVAARAVDRYG